MIIGLSLPLAYLSGTPNTDNSRCLAEAFGKPLDCLDELEDHGVRSIELQAFGPDSSAADLQLAVGSILDSGMALTLHGYLSAAATAREFHEFYPRLAPALAPLRAREQSTVMVVHALVDPQTSRSAMAEATRTLLARLGEAIHREGVPLRLALEINRYHGIETPDTTYAGILDMAAGLDESVIGFCWDMGHTRSSVLQGKLPPRPPREFLARVIHTHLHGISPEGDTHRALMGSSSHIASGLEQLRAAGYDATGNLELYPVRWAAEVGVREGILGSISCLQEIMARWS